MALAALAVTLAVCAAPSCHSRKEKNITGLAETCSRIVLLFCVSNNMILYKDRNFRKFYYLHDIVMPQFSQPFSRPILSGHAASASVHGHALAAIRGLPSSGTQQLAARSLLGRSQAAASCAVANPCPYWLVSGMPNCKVYTPENARRAPPTSTCVKSSAELASVTSTLLPAGTKAR